MTGDLKSVSLGWWTSNTDVSFQWELLHFGVFEERVFSGNKVISKKYIVLHFFQLSSTGREHRPNFVPVGANGSSVMLILERARFGMVYAGCRLKQMCIKKPISYIEHHFVQVCGILKISLLSLKSQLTNVNMCTFRVQSCMSFASRNLLQAFWHW